MYPARQVTSLSCSPQSQGGLRVNALPSCWHHIKTYQSENRTGTWWWWVIRKQGQGKATKWFNLEKGRHGNSLLKGKRQLLQGPACSPCPMRVWRDRHLTLQGRRFKLYVKGKLLKVRLANHVNRWCGASGKKIESLGDLWSWGAKDQSGMMLALLGLLREGRGIAFYLLPSSMS